MFLGVGSGFRFLSYDGSNWNVTASSPTLNPAGVAYGNGAFMTFGTNSQFNANYVLESTNGTTWTKIYTSSNTLTAGAYGNNTWVFIGSNDIVAGTSTSSNWDWSEFQPPFSPLSIVYGDGNFAVCGLFSGTNFGVVSSSDGMIWQYQSYLFSSIPSGPCSGTVAYGNGTFVVSGSYEYAQGYYWEGSESSSNLSQWLFSGEQEDVYNGELPSSHVAFGGGQFLLDLGYTGPGGSAAQSWTSPDGYNWTPISGLYNPLNAAVFGQGTFVAVVDTVNTIYQSDFFASESNPAPTALAIAAYPGVTINGTPGATYQIQSTTSLNSGWTTVTNFTLPYSPFLWIDTSTTVRGQKFYRSVQLQ